MNKITAQQFEDMVLAVQDLLRCTPGMTLMPNILYIIGLETKGMALTWEEEREIAHNIMRKVKHSF